MNPSWEIAVSDVKPQGLRTAAGIPLRVIGGIRLTTQTGQRVSNTRLLVIENLAVDILLGTEIIDANVKTIFPKKQIVHLVSSSSVAMKGNDQEDSSDA